MLTHVPSAGFATQCPRCCRFNGWYPYEAAAEHAAADAGWHALPDYQWLCPVCKKETDVPCYCCEESEYENNCE